MSEPQPPHDPALDEESPPADPAVDPDEGYDLPVSELPAPTARPAAQAHGAVRAFVFFTAATIAGAALGQTIGLGVAAAIMGVRLPLTNPDALQAATERLMAQPLGWFCMGSISLLFTLVVTWAFTRWWDRRPLSSVGLQVDSTTGRQFMAGLALGAALMIGIFLVEAAAGWLHVIHVDPLPRLLARALIGFVALLPAAAAEELMLRGYTFQALEEQWGTAAATVITAVAFSTLHRFNPDASWASFWGILVSGILFGVAYVVTRRLWLPIGLHVAWNLFEGPILGFPVSGFDFPSAVNAVIAGPALWTGGAFGPEAGLLGILASAAGALLLAKGLPAKARHGEHGDTEGHGGIERPSG